MRVVVFARRGRRHSRQTGSARDVLEQFIQEHSGQFTGEQIEARCEGATAQAWHTLEHQGRIKFGLPKRRKRAARSRTVD